MSNNFERSSKLSLKSTRSVPIISTNQNHKISKNNSKSTEQIKTNAQQSQLYLDSMHKIVDQTDDNLRRAIEHAASRHEQLKDLHIRSEEMLHKNENLVFGITNYRKAQERDVFWRRFRYTAFGTLTIGIIILIIILSITNKRLSSSSQIINIQHSDQDRTSTMILSIVRRRRRKRDIFKDLNKFLSSKTKRFLLSD